MTTRDFEMPFGREIAISRTGKSAFRRNGTWTMEYKDEYPPTTQVQDCLKGDPSHAVSSCAKRCLDDTSCRSFWTYTKGVDAGTCCLKTAVIPGPLKHPACPTCGGEFYSMDGEFVRGNGSNFDSWGTPALAMRGTNDHQLYSQITWRFYDMFFGIVMTFDATNSSGHVHCMLSYSTDDANTWNWVDPEGLAALKEFIPAGRADSFDSHICFAAHLPLKMPDGTSRVYYMGGDGPHNGQRKSSFALATLPPDRFAGVVGAGISSSEIFINGSAITATVDVAPSGSFALGIVGAKGFEKSLLITSSGTDIAIEFPGASIASLSGKSFKLQTFIEGKGRPFSLSA